MAGGSAHGVWSHERIVLALAVVLFAAAALFLPGFRDIGNLISIVRSVSVLVLLAVGMAIVIIGCGIDISAVAIMAMSAAWYLQLLNDGWSEWQAIGATGAGVLAISLVNGFLVVYADMQVIFANLATGSFIFGLVRSLLITQDAVPVPAGNWLEQLGTFHPSRIPREFLSSRLPTCLPTSFCASPSGNPRLLQV